MPKAIPGSIDIVGASLSPYTKDDDPKGFIRGRVNAKVMVNGKRCQVTGYLAEIRKK